MFIYVFLSNMHLTTCKYGIVCILAFGRKNSIIKRNERENLVWSYIITVFTIIYSYSYMHVCRTSTMSQTVLTLLWNIRRTLLPLPPPPLCRRLSSPYLTQFISLPLQSVRLIRSHSARCRTKKKKKDRLCLPTLPPRGRTQRTSIMDPAAATDLGWTFTLSSLLLT